MGNFTKHFTQVHDNLIKIWDLSLRNILYLQAHEAINQLIQLFSQMRLKAIDSDNIHIATNRNIIADVASNSPLLSSTQISSISNTFEKVNSVLNGNWDLPSIILQHQTKRTSLKNQNTKHNTKQNSDRNKTPYTMQRNHKRYNTKKYCSLDTWKMCPCQSVLQNTKPKASNRCYISRQNTR